MPTRTQNNPKNKLSIYLIKGEFVEDEDILKDVDSLESEGINDVGIFYYGESHIYKPTWINKFFGSSLSGQSNLFNASSKGVLLVKVEVDSSTERIFAIPFGYGWTLLSPGVWEERFGLKVVLNILDSDSLRRIDKKNMSSIPKDTSEQLSRAGVAADFGIDFEQDLIRSITGKSQIEQFGKTITGKDALNVSARVDISNIKAFLVECYDKYRSDDYKEDFGWVDQITDIRDPQVIDKLNEQLIQNINEETWDKTWMAVPELVDWSDVSGFAYKRGSSEYKDDIDLPSFLESLQDNDRDNYDLGTLKKGKIYCYSESSGELKHQWKAYECIYCEVLDDDRDKTYILSNGSWFEIENDFARQVNSEYEQLRDKSASLELPSYSHKNEHDYNEAVSEQDAIYCCMDGDNISYGG